MGCVTCTSFINDYLPKNVNRVTTKSIKRRLQEGLTELLVSMGIDTLLVEDCLELKIDNFVNDFLRMVDEVSCAKDIVDMWHIQPHVAHEIHNLFTEVVLEVQDVSEITVFERNEEEEKSDMEFSSGSESEYSDLYDNFDHTDCSLSESDVISDSEYSDEDIFS